MNQEKGEASGFPGIEQRNDVRMMQSGRDRNLREEPLGPQRHGHFRTQYFQRDGPFVFAISGEEHRACATLTDLPIDLVIHP